MISKKTLQNLLRELKTKDTKHESMLEMIKRWGKMEFIEELLKLAM